MMEHIIWMFLNVLFGIGLYVLLRNISTRRADEVQVLCINYIVAGVCCMILYHPESVSTSVSVQKMLVPAILLGVLFIVCFWVVAHSSSRCGIGITTTAAKMSVVVPVMVGIIAFRQLDNMWVKIIGLMLAMCSFLLIFLPKNKEKRSRYFLPLMVFILSGITDTGTDIGNRFFAPTQNDRYLFLMVTFFAAFIVGALISIYDIQHKRKKLLLSSAILGVLLGLCNFGYMVALMKNLQQIGSSIVFPVLNTSIVIGTVFTGIVFYKEKLDRTQWMGIALATVAVLLIALSQYT
jgi:drug/metabolite transporter (DMT)-like permease